MKKFDAIIIGAGCAGLSAATSLSEKGKRVLVLEKRNILGGRACSYPDPQTGEILDNGQHLLLGCYKETIQFLKRLNQEEKLRFYAGLDTPMFGSDGASSRLRAFLLPAPFHLLLGLLCYEALSWGDRWAIVRASIIMRKKNPELSRISCAQWLKDLNQSHECRERFWDLVILATLNVPPELAPADLLQVVMQQGFLGSQKDSRVGLSAVGLSDLYANPAKVYLENRESEVRSGQTVEEVLFENGCVKGVKLFGGENIFSPNVICTVPPSALEKIKILDSTLKAHIQKSENLKPSPIVSFHFWADIQPVDETYIGFWGTHFHWAFQKKKVYGDQKTKHWTLVASGADDMVEKTKDELIQLAKKELSSVPQFKNVNITRAKIVVERQATWVPPLGGTSGRLQTKTSIQGFYLAGDWTDTGLPCTIESAVISGHKAAEAIQLTA